MTMKVVTREKSVQELIELRWRINKLEEMKNCKSRVEKKVSQEEKSVIQSQSSQFFLSLGSSQAVPTMDNFRISGINYTIEAYKNK